MPFSLLPKIITDELTDITPALLRERKIRLLMLDFDNTIVPYTTTTPTPEMENWLKTMNELEDIHCFQQPQRPGPEILQGTEYGCDYPRKETFYQGHQRMSRQIRHSCRRSRPGRGPDLYRYPWRQQRRCDFHSGKGHPQS